MELTDIRLLFAGPDAYIDKEITVGGWIRNKRLSKNVGFFVVNDGTYFKPLQVVYSEDLPNFDIVSKQNVGAAIVVKGTLVATPGAQQPFEIQAKEITVEGPSTEDYPIQPKRHTMEYLRTVPHLRARTNTFEAVFRVRSLIAYAIHTFFMDRGFVYVHTPLITSSDCEGAGEMFQVTTLDLENPPKTEDGQVDYSQDFFGKHTSLTVSGQLNVETYAFAFKNVYTFGPTFRAENSNTTRHLAEFWMVEPEVAFYDLNDNAALAERMLKYVFNAVLTERRDDMEFFAQRVDPEAINRLEKFVSSDFAQVDYTDAIEILKNCGKKFEYPVEWGVDLQSEHERYLAEEHFKAPVVVKNYPKDIKAFYMRLNDDGKTVAAMDVLAPGIGEIIGGSQREERLDVLDKRLAELNLDPKNYWWYRDLRRYGSVTHSGFGLGFERLVVYVTGMGNVRDVIPFPRTVNNADF